ncbi:GNAT family N-acetyltransferase [Nitratireductor sp. CAU 1489]|uniref:GNAT family N-acetyltransferase n=1 Tax=Nitratireductor arenosus TaxID=2682096 RepID=A0A844QDX1_9HYPH|nr:N-acetyltransferase [Nitratireductor arenosus]MVA98196.1 GNAT family N-acetyltransferase [Nitratireductor arenosus]
MRTLFSLRGRRREFLAERLLSADAAALSSLHADGFARPWSDGEFAALLDQETVFGFAAREVGRPGAAPGGFVLARQAAGEGEILTLVVAPALRRCGLGWLLMDAVLRELYAQRAEALFLEVDETNRAAVALYRKLGFSQVGARPAYYAQKTAPRTAALVMRRDLV